MLMNIIFGIVSNIELFRDGKNCCIVIRIKLAVPVLKHISIKHSSGIL